MSKPIINGIDVSECEYATDSIPVDCENNTCFCYEDENCYFKQLKHLQKENDELKKKQITKNGFICDCEQNTKYKQALEEIKGIAKDAYDNDQEYQATGVYNEILDKINEALKNET